jgi:hypothetical protein
LNSAEIFLTLVDGVKAVSGLEWLARDLRREAAAAINLMAREG